MDFEWDEEKNQENIRKHGFDFADAWRIFEAPLLETLDIRMDYGEDRWTGIGLLGNRIVVVTYTLETRIPYVLFPYERHLSMNGKDLKKRSETDWTRIDLMTDEEIDTSDIPPLDDAFFAAAKWRLPRSYIYLNDFKQARKFASFILKQGLHEKTTEQEKLIHLAFNTSLIISYARPFRGNNNFEGQPRSSLRQHACEVLDEAEVEIHDRILALRDNAYAHSDARSHLLESLDYTKHIGLMRTIETLDKSTTGKLKVIIEKWIGYLEAEKSKLKRPRTQQPRRA